MILPTYLSPVKMNSLRHDTIASKHVTTTYMGKEPTHAHAQVDKRHLAVTDTDDEIDVH